MNECFKFELIKKIKREFMWYLITIDDPKFLKTESIINVIKLISFKMNFKFVILNYIDGAGDISELLEKEQVIMEINDLIKITTKIESFDWGDFFLFKDYPTTWNTSPNNFYPHAISQTNTTVRAVDGQYMYIYTPHEEVVEIINDNYLIESIKISSLEVSDYPC